MNLSFIESDIAEFKRKIESNNNKIVALHHRNKFYEIKLKELRKRQNESN